MFCTPRGVPLLNQTLVLEEFLISSTPAEKNSMRDLLQLAKEYAEPSWNTKLRPNLELSASVRDYVRMLIGEVK